MHVNEAPPSQRIEQLLQAERPRLLRWCARLVGDRDVAEDLAQETLSAAWANEHWPAHEEEYLPWLMGIARNICRSWLRQRQRELAHYVERVSSLDKSVSDIATTFADPFDHEMELEREELAQILDHALALLPQEARAVLIAKYIDERSLRDIAGRLNITESALTARLHRGKIALRKVLTTHLRAEMATYGFVTADEDLWQQTRIWCPDCGQYRLLGQLNNAIGTFRLRCPGCFAHAPVDFAHWRDPQLFGDIKSYRSALSRLSTWGYLYYREGIEAGVARCIICGNTARAVRATGGNLAPELQQMPCILVQCSHCRHTATTSLEGLAICHPGAQRFWRRHPRLQTVPGRLIAFQGRSAYITSFVSNSENAQLDVLSDSETLVVLHTQEGVANV